MLKPMITNRFEALKWASSFLKKHNADDNAGEILLQHRLGLDRTGLLMSLRDPLNAEDRTWFVEKVTEHVEKGTPIQHMTGVEMFYGRAFLVSPDVLIPRPETEEVVQHALNEIAAIHGSKKIKVVDIGTGSGAIAITIAKENPSAQVTAVDVSQNALKIAMQNADRLEADVTFIKGDLLTPFLNNDTFDVVVSNPPYISKDEMAELHVKVRGHEPTLALTDDSDGLTFYRRIINQLDAVMNHELLVVFEIGHQQGDAVAALIQAAFPEHYTDLKVVKDINSNERIVSARVFK